jgi:excisionase family DNA binding protein
VRDVLRDELARMATNAPQPPPTETYLTVADAATIAGVSAATVRGWMHEGDLPSQRAGRFLRVKRSDLEAFMHGGKSPAADSDDLDDLAEQLLSRGRRKAA